MPKTIHDAPSGPTPLGPYSVVTEAAGLVFVSGMIAIVPETGKPLDGDISQQAHLILRTANW